MSYLHYFNLVKGALGETPQKREFVQGCKTTIDETLGRFPPDQSRSSPEIQKALDDAVIGYMVKQGYLIQRGNEYQIKSNLRQR